MSRRADLLQIKEYILTSLPEIHEFLKKPKEEKTALEWKLYYQWQRKVGGLISNFIDIPNDVNDILCGGRLELSYAEKRDESNNPGILGLLRAMPNIN